jgi:hypothetical protein
MAGSQGSVFAAVAGREELIMEYQVDAILNGWFGEPPEHSEQEQRLLRHLYVPLRKLEHELQELRDQVAQLRAQLNPERESE